MQSRNRVSIEWLISELKRIHSLDYNPERDHLLADNALLKYINNKHITEAYDRIYKWYS